MARLGSMEVAAARKKIISHLEKTTVDSKNFYPSETIAWYWWHVINKAVFYGDLPKPSSIVIKKMRKFDGYCQSDETNNACIITISPHIKCKKLFISTIAHEMVHQWQFHIGNGCLNHGQQFRDWNEYFKNNLKIIL